MQSRSHALRGCSAYILRPHIFAGASVENYLMGAFRGTPNGKSPRAEKMRSEGKRLPCMLPRGQQYLDNKIQFIHVDDMARLIRHILQREPETQRLTVFNVAGRGDPLTFGRCVEMAQAKLVRVPGRWAMRQVLKFLWKQKISAIPPEAVPYMTGEYIMNTDRLRRFLGPEYEHVIRYTIADAFADSVRRDATAPPDFGRALLAHALEQRVQRPPARAVNHQERNRQQLRVFGANLVQHRPHPHFRRRRRAAAEAKYRGTAKSWWREWPRSSRR